MEYIAHIRDDNEVQTLKNHLLGTAKLTSDFAKVFDKSDWGYCCGLLHDIGKYSKEFQERIRGSNKKVDHSTPGMKVCLEKSGLHSLLAYCVAGHHSGIPDYGDSFNSSNSPTVIGRNKKDTCNCNSYKNEIAIPELNSLPINPNKANCLEFSLSVFIRMLYSCLVDADYLDTELFMNNGNIKRDSGESIKELYDKLFNHIKDWLKNTDTNTINGRRTEILRNCLKEGNNNKGMFRLTVPTGGGKTISSLAFALEHAKKNNMDRIIYVIPYTSIIEQNAGVFREILGSNNVLENHCNVEYDDNNEDDKSLKLATENWDKPVVVTTNVQFFESLFSNKPSKCRKLHNIANSVIIFDEVQMLPIYYLKPCLAMLEELVVNYKSSIVLCSATQPTFDSLFKIVKEIKELCPRVEEQFDFFKRNTIKNIGKINEEYLIDLLNNENQALCIVNTKKRAQRIYTKLTGEGVYHLSTNMCPKHRKEVLSEIKDRLNKNERCVVISTNLIEAGVDVDFKSVYRQLAGIDSIIQAAGRCNREGRYKVEESIVYIFQFKDKEFIPDQQQQIDIAKILLEYGYDLSEDDTVTEYFKNLYSLKESEFDKKNIMKSFENKAYEFAEVGKKFKLIEENTKTVFIKYDNEADDLLYKLKNCGFTKSLVRKANQYSVNIRENDFNRLIGIGALNVIADNLDGFYELNNMELYSKEFGLKYVENGNALFI